MFKSLARLVGQVGGARLSLHGRGHKRKAERLESVVLSLPVRKEASTIPSYRTSVGTQMQHETQEIE
eukprot:1182998-Pyramimonas_sp.AAC.1